jgi:hypothetical protein
MLNAVHDYYQLGFVDFVDIWKSPRRAENKPSSAPSKGFPTRFGFSPIPPSSSANAASHTFSGSRFRYLRASAVNSISYNGAHSAIRSRNRIPVPGAELARDCAIEAIKAGSRTMPSVSSSDSKSSGLMSRNDGRPFLVTRIRSCSTSTRCASSERCALASLKTTVRITGQTLTDGVASVNPLVAITAPVVGDET